MISLIESRYNVTPLGYCHCYMWGPVLYLNQGSGEYKVEYNNELTVILSKIKESKDVKKDKEQIITSNKQCITFQKDLIKTTRKKVGKFMIV